MYIPLLTEKNRLIFIYIKQYTHFHFHIWNDNKNNNNCMFAYAVSFLYHNRFHHVLFLEAINNPAVLILEG